MRLLVNERLFHCIQSVWMGSITIKGSRDFFFKGSEIES